MGNRRSYVSCDFDQGCRWSFHDQGHHGQGGRQLWDADSYAMTRDTMDEEGGNYGMQMVIP